MTEPRDAAIGGVLGDVVEAYQRSAALYDLSEHEAKMTNELIADAMLVERDGPPALRFTVQQLTALAAAYGVLRRWSVSYSPRLKLGDAVKVLPPEETHAIMSALAWAGLVDPSDVPDPPDPCGE